MARYEAASLSKEVTAYWTTKEGVTPFRITDAYGEMFLTTQEALAFVQFVAKCVAEMEEMK